MTRAIWIVDGAYLFAASPGKLDYLKLKGVLESLNGDRFYESYYLNSTPSPPEDSQNSFHTWLKTAMPYGPKMRVQLYELKTMSVRCPECTAQFERSVQKGVDVGIATLIVKLAVQDLYDRLVLSAGDGDFEDAIAYVKSELHKELWISGFGKSISADLQSYADEVVWLNELWEQIEKL